MWLTNKDVQEYVGGEVCVLDGPGNWFFSGKLAKASVEFDGVMRFEVKVERMLNLDFVHQWSRLGNGGMFQRKLNQSECRVFNIGPDVNGSGSGDRVRILDGWEVITISCPPSASGLPDYKRGQEG